MRVLSIDYGKVRSGLAISDQLKITAQPLRTIPTEQLFSTVSNIIEEYEIDKIICGFPLQLNGQEGPAALYIKEVRDKLAKKIKMDIELVDERLTTATVQRTLIEADTSRNKRKNVVDKLAATLLLQNSLDRVRD